MGARLSGSKRPAAQSAASTAAHMTLESDGGRGRKPSKLERAVAQLEIYFAPIYPVIVGSRFCVAA
jgi:hypothetical protein